MNLVLDIGNTRLKAAVFEGSSYIQSMNISYSDLNDFFVFYEKYNVKVIGVSSVKRLPQSLQAFLDNFPGAIITIDPSVNNLPIRIAYKTPDTLGHDRICNVLAASLDFPLANILVVDLGTCNKYDFIDENGVYHGGSISPGFKMRLDSMNHFTDQLPLLSPESIDQLIGENTKNSMLTGAYNGILGEINFIIEQYNLLFSDIKVILTGGFATYFEKALKNHIFADPYLTLKGMNEILHIQVNK